MKEIQEIINAKVKEMVEGGVITKLIETSIEKAITNALEAQFESWGSVTKSLNESFEVGLQINTRDLPFETYNEQMLVAVKSKMGAAFQGAASEKFMSEIDKMLAPAPKQMTINKLVESIVGLWKTGEPWDADGLDEYATVEITENDYPLGGFNVKMWKQKESRYGSSCPEDVHLFIPNETIRINHNHRYNPTCLTEHDAFVFKLYAAGTKITGLADFDECDCDLTLKSFDC